MADYAEQYPISKMSDVFKVSRSGYYSWLGRDPSKRAKQNERLRRLIHEAWQDSDKLYGSPRIYNLLKKDGCTASRPRIARLMAKMGIASRIRKKWIKTTHSTHGWPVAANLLDRNFAPEGLGQVWVSDITYIRGEKGWMYLTTVMDLGDRQIIGWSLSGGMSAEETSIAAFKQAAMRRPPGKHLIFHSDRGVQYACDSFTKVLGKHRITQSMSRKGNCWDNAPAESFFKTLKHELDMPDYFQSYQQARSAIFEFIEIWYNRKRLHSALDYQSPVQAEENLKHKSAA
ncbi:IS3 family transposase [Rhodohalobacter sp.]|uniref:IS3 family transposase n=1 Tax=Rhodohalobacter sp. TaxID=1974210 RepID=UPI002ACE1B64|nr:IS3 family transposase [Rhodohalobacter sp.]MDZ7757263.1 IS3 family transposase [Rhodohalobacter sp.]